MRKAGKDARIALVGWAADSGVGRELIDAARNLPVTAAFVLENAAKPTRRDLLRIPYFISKGGSESDMAAFLDGYKPDTILTWEVPGNWAFPDMWKKRGLKWVHMVHWDWFPPRYHDTWQKAVLLSPNRMCQRNLEALELPSTYLPVPTDTDRLRFLPRKRARTFISVYGFGGLYERRSLKEVCEAWRMMKNPPELRILAQKEPSELSGGAQVPNAKISIGNADEPSNLYDFGDVAVQPSRYEGVGVSMLEAQARGVPVIAIDAPPMNEIVRDLLVPVERVIDISIMEKTLPSYVPAPGGIAVLVESIVGTDIEPLSRRAREMVEKEFSWNALRQKWLDILRS